LVPGVNPVTANVFVPKATLVLTGKVTPPSVERCTIYLTIPVVGEAAVQLRVIPVAVTLAKVRLVGPATDATLGVKVNILFAKLAMATLAAKIFVVGDVAEVFTVGVVATVTNAEALAVLPEL
jgi:hypothetical protein